MTFRYDLHLHTNASPDCKTSLQSLIAVARRRKLTGIAVTDHDTMDGIKRLSEIWPHDQLQLISGCERTLSDGSHVIGLFLTEPLVGKSPQEVVSEIRAQGGLVYLPHPFRSYSGLLGAGSRFSDADKSWTLENCNIIEVYNSKCLLDENIRALKLLEKYPKAFAASSDAHYAHEIGIACTEFTSRLSPEEFTSIAAYAPPAADAERLADLRMGVEPTARKETREVLKKLRLFPMMKSLRNSVRCHLSPKLERYS